VVGQPGCTVMTRLLERFQTDRSRRFPQSSGRSRPRPVESATADVAEVRPEVRFQKLPPEIAVLLMIIGTAGIFLPGPVGSPFLVAGGIALWPTAFRKVERWFMKVAPGIYQKGVPQMERFLADLERRYPGSV
jgi:hypothetical protein